jgi:hypothetical protein
MLGILLHFVTRALARFSHTGRKLQHQRDPSSKSQQSERLPLSAYAVRAEYLTHSFPFVACNPQVIDRVVARSTSQILRLQVYGIQINLLYVQHVLWTDVARVLPRPEDPQATTHTGQFTLIIEGKKPFFSKFASFLS